MTAALTPDVIDDAMIDMSVSLLEAHPDFKLLRRFIPDPARYIVRGDHPDFRAQAQDADRVRAGLFVDVETTSLDTETAKIVQLAVVPFEFCRESGVVFDAGKGRSWYEDPGEPIDPAVTAIHGITDEMVRGQRIDDEALSTIARNTQLVLAHNADFDRPITERRIPFFASHSWACSYREVPWKDRFGAACSKLGHLLMEVRGEFHDAHRALDDCHAALNLLANGIDGDGRSAMAHLLDSARSTTHRVRAIGAPFNVKDKLKARGYRWNAERKHWFRDVKAEGLNEELVWCRDIAGVSAPKVDRLTAKDRFSVRAS